MRGIRYCGHAPISKEKSVNIRAALHKSARTGASPKYLFSGLLKCGCCGANYIITDYYRYSCSNHVNRGKDVCPNSIRVPRKVVESQLLAAIKKDLFTPEGIDLFKKEVSRLLAEKKAAGSEDKKRVKRTLEKVEKEIEIIMAAIREGIITPTTKEALEKAEQEKAELERKLKFDLGEIDQMDALLIRAVDRFKELVDDLENTLQRQISRARTQIKALLGDEAIRLVPITSGGLNAELKGNYAGILELTKTPGPKRTGGQLSLVAGARFKTYLISVPLVKKAA